MKTTLSLLFFTCLFSSISAHAELSVGFVHLETPTTIESRCIIPAHSGGSTWGCRALPVSLYHTADYANVLTVTNLSNPSGKPVILTDLTTRQVAELNLLDSRDEAHTGLKMVDGTNQIEFVIYEIHNEDRNEISREIVELKWIQLNDY